MSADASSLARVAFALVILAACGRPLPPRAPAAPTPRPLEATRDAAVPDASALAPPERAACDQAEPGGPIGALSWRGVARILHLRVDQSTPGPEWERSRCVAIDLRVLEVLKGDETIERPGDRVHVVVRQSMITRYTSRPAGAWWVVEQPLTPGSELVAFCAASGPAAVMLRGPCSVLPADDVLADLHVIRDSERERASLDELIARVQRGCAAASHLVTGHIWLRFLAESAHDARALDAILALLVEPTCSRTARTSLLINVAGAVGMTIDDGSLPEVRRVARALFRLLAMPEILAERDNLIGVYLPNVLGLSSGLRHRSATEIFAGDAAARRAAGAALRAYTGSASAAPLRRWIAQ